MVPARRKALTVLVLASAAAALAHVATPRVKLADLNPPLDLAVMFPPNFDGWRVDVNMPVILPAPDVQAKLNAIYNQVLSRTYVDRQGRRIMLSVAYGGDQSDGMSVHLPEVCYPAQGFQVISRRNSGLVLAGGQIPIVRLVTRLGSRVEPVIYWITVGNTVVADRTQQKLAKIRYGLNGQIPDGMLVRVSSIDSDSERAFELQRDFIEELLSAMPSAARARVAGMT